MSKKSLQPFSDIAKVLWYCYPRKVGRVQNSNISYSDSEAEIILIYGGCLAKVLQYISKGGREMAICVAIYKNEGTKGKAKAAVAFVASTHVRRELSLTHLVGKQPRN